MANRDETADTRPADRPRVVVSVTASVDGRVTLRPSSVLLEPEAQAAWQSLHPPGAAELIAERHAWIESRHGHRFVLEGSGTFVTESASPSALPPLGQDLEETGSPYLPGARDCRWFVVVDGRGRVRWTFTGDHEVRLLVLVCESTPRSYLAYLRREEIPYLVAGTGHVDLPEALALLKIHLGADCVVSEAGGGLNGALLRAGLVDELHLVLLPALVGGRGTPSVFDGPPLPRLDAATRLRLVNVRSSPDGAVWLHYETDRSRAT